MGGAYVMCGTWMRGAGLAADVTIWMEIVGEGFCGYLWMADAGIEGGGGGGCL